MFEVELCALDEEALSRLLEVAVTHADPEETMPPLPNPSGWTAECRAAFCEYHRSRREGLDGPHGEATYGVRVGGQIVGAGRLARGASPDTLEAGVWVADTLRGRGLGTAVLGALIDAAAEAGATRVVAEATVDNPAALGILRACGAALSPPGPDGSVRAELTI